MFLTNLKNCIENEIKTYLKKKVRTECSEFVSENFFAELKDSSFFKTNFGYILLPIDFIGFITVELENQPDILFKNVLKRLKENFKHIDLEENLIHVKNIDLEKYKYKYFICYIMTNDKIMKIGLIIKLNYLFLEENNFKNDNNELLNKIKKIKKYIENAELKGNINTPKICINLDNAKEILKDIEFIEKKLEYYSS